MSLGKAQRQKIGLPPQTPLEARQKRRLNQLARTWSKAQNQLLKQTDVTDATRRKTTSTDSISSSHSADAQADVRSGVWQKLVGPKGKPYYLNTETLKTTWDKPPEFGGTGVNLTDTLWGAVSDDGVNLDTVDAASADGLVTVVHKLIAPALVPRFPVTELTVINSASSDMTVSNSTPTSAPGDSKAEAEAEAKLDAALERLNGLQQAESELSETVEARQVREALEAAAASATATLANIKQSHMQMSDQATTGSKCANEGGTCTCSGTVYYGKRFKSGKPGAGAENSFLDMIATGGYTSHKVDTEMHCKIGTYVASTRRRGGRRRRGHRRRRRRARRRAVALFPNDPAHGYYKACYCTEGLRVYKVRGTQVNAEEARSRCANHGQLAMPRSAREQAAIEAAVKASGESGSAFWIGANFSNATLRFEWQDRTPMCGFLNWAPKMGRVGSGNAAPFVAMQKGTGLWINAHSHNCTHDKKF
jgi:hypothetical protein